MPNSLIDGLTSPTLKHLREAWWNDDFTEFLAERLRPRPGNRILDVGCGEGLAEVAIGRLHLSQVSLVGVDIAPDKVLQARRETAAHNQRVALAAGDAVQLPFQTGIFDSTYCVAVLQHVRDVEAAVSELARVTRDNGRVVVVEPDNAARYVYSSAPSGSLVFTSAAALFSAVSQMRRDPGEAVIGPTIAERFVRHGIEPMEVHVFPVAQSYLGAPPADVWSARRLAMERVTSTASSDAVAALARDYFELLAAYEGEANAAGQAFVEIQSTPLFATVGQRQERAS